VGASPLFPFVWKGGRKMAKREEYEAKTESFLMPLMEENNYELVDVEYIKEAGNWYLRAYIDKEGGITVDDCEIISRRLGDWLDEKDFIADSYILEVSSPGLGRPLKKDKDFERSIGKDVDIRLYKAFNKQKDFNGTLKSYDKETVTITQEDETELVFGRPEIALIRLAFDF
jgi:ribosome maturation factor RimP